MEPSATPSEARLARPWPLTTHTQGVAVPTMVYGTAWKEDRTADLVRTALRAGFRGIDTANQRRHYHEAGVGEAVGELLRAGVLERPDLFVQTKFTYVHGQDHRLPYDPRAPLERQVHQSLARSLEHLGVETLDSYVLHGPWSYPGLAPQDLEAWAAMEELQRAGATRLLGVSNVTAPQLEALHQAARVKPAVVQNRCFTRPQADAAVRAFCRDHGILYQGFSLLTAIRPLLDDPRLGQVAHALDKTPAQVVLRYCLVEGMVVLTGTTSRHHMDEDMAVHALHLDAATMATVRQVLG